MQTNKSTESLGQAFILDPFSHFQLYKAIQSDMLSRPKSNRVQGQFSEKRELLNFYTKPQITLSDRTVFSLSGKGSFFIYWNGTLKCQQKVSELLSPSHELSVFLPNTKELVCCIGTYLWNVCIVACDPVWDKNVTIELDPIISVYIHRFKNNIHHTDPSTFFCYFSQSHQSQITNQKY